MRFPEVLVHSLYPIDCWCILKSGKYPSPKLANLRIFLVWKFRNASSSIWKNNYITLRSVEYLFCQIQLADCHIPPVWQNCQMLLEFGWHGGFAQPAVYGKCCIWQSSILSYWRSKGPGTILQSDDFLMSSSLSKYMSVYTFSNYREGGRENKKDII